MDEYIELNRAHWDEVTPLHVASDFYDLASFRAGRSTLLPIELAEVGDTRGKTMLHLQCHFGMDTLSRAREGAAVTGVDFSGPAIAAARALASELRIEATFIESNIYDLPGVLGGEFDVVFASYGVTCWLPDFAGWAKIASGYLKPGGRFYLIDGHPLVKSLDDAAEDGRIELKYDYLSGSGKPQSYPAVDGSYAAREAKLQHFATAEFSHDLGEIITALINAGLEIELLHEWPCAAWQVLPQMTKSDDGYWRLPQDSPRVPFTFSVRARKPLRDFS